MRGLEDAPFLLLVVQLGADPERAGGHEQHVERAVLRGDGLRRPLLPPHRQHRRPRPAHQERGPVVQHLPGEVPELLRRLDQERHRPRAERCQLQLPHQPAVRAVEPAEQPLADLHQVGVTDRVIVRLGLPGQVGDLTRVERAAGELVRVVAPVAQLDLIRTEIGQRDEDDADGHGRAPGGSRGDRHRPLPHRSYPNVNGAVRGSSPNLAKIRGRGEASRRRGRVEYGVRLALTHFRRSSYSRSHALRGNAVPNTLRRLRPASPDPATSNGRGASKTDSHAERGNEGKSLQDTDFSDILLVPAGTVLSFCYRGVMRRICQL